MATTHGVPTVQEMVLTDLTSQLLHQYPHLGGHTRAIGLEIAADISPNLSCFQRWRWGGKRLRDQSGSREHKENDAGQRKHVLG